MLQKIKSYILEARPRQWSKNFVIFIPILFSGELFINAQLVTVIKAFIIFSALSSVSYYFNDIRDIRKDRRHPSKQNRPIAAGKIRIREALIIATLLAAGALYWAYQLSEYFFSISIIYLVVTVLYSLYLKRIALLESIIIAIGFVLRIMAGSLIISVPISSWLTVSTISVALLISFGRRKAEITLLGFKKAAKHRPVLAEYPKKFLEVMISSLAASTFLSYVLFTFTEERFESLSVVLRDVLPNTLNNPKWMMLTIPFAFYSLARYIFLIYNDKANGEPEKIIISDKAFLVSLALWTVLVMLIIYV